MKPIRIQRLRKKGFNLQKASPNGLPVVYVGRPTKWGNPIKLDNGMIYIDAGYRRKILDPWVYYNLGNIDDVLHLYWHILKGTQFQIADLQYWSDKFKENNIEELRGKNLACWCSISSKCHADVILDLLYN
ncbi:MAG: DUF4326 domain-containing protein [Melioribacteraceae bacterium]|jgi:hypothetical protein|nr:DUF4326 domain-containing protein [Melioribacteraceae bacterium]